MIKTRVYLDDLLEIQERLITDIWSRLERNTKTFLLRLHDGRCDLYAIERQQATDLPVLRWKPINLGKLKSDSPTKHAEHRSALKVPFTGRHCGRGYVLGLTGICCQMRGMSASKVEFKMIITSYIKRRVSESGV